MNMATATVLSTAIGGATTTRRLKQQVPETTSLSLDYYLLSGPLSSLLNCVDPNIKTVGQYLEKGEEIRDELKKFITNFEQSLEKLRVKTK